MKSVWTTKAHVHFFRLPFSCPLTGLVTNITFIMIPVSIIDSCLFFLMLACLGGVVWSLWQPSPAHTAIGNQACSQSSFKRRAVGNVLVVAVPAVISYLPVVAVVPLVVYLIHWDMVLEGALCNVVESASMFPRLGVLIGPLFYLSKARQMCWLCGTETKFDELSHSEYVSCCVFFEAIVLETIIKQMNENHTFKPVLWCAVSSTISGSPLPH